ncbi:hypothetical protein MUK42_16197 [Musa troglodytarum]|uniref:Uncharacterized protein n=1 Tax=Musa troglodytarum TaxID=320322 RepID=A0A9E7KXS0_9LILI|nr:hypothetical protein MUK42_16197 [Musa troglodytarum]
MCYVGKATKIFFFLVGALLVAGLVVGFGLVRHGWAHKTAAQPCQSSSLTAAGCRPIFPDPIPADTATIPTGTIPVPPPPPAATATATDVPSPPTTPPPTATATDVPAPASSTAAPPLVSFGPPSPVYQALGPAHA